MSGKQLNLDEALSRLARADRTDEIEQLIAEHPELAGPEFIDQLDRRIDEIERTGGSNWWGLTRAGTLLRGYRDGELKDALFGCWTRDLLPLGPDDIRRRVEAHPELLSERADKLLAHLASGYQAAGQQKQAGQIEMRRDFLRERALEQVRALYQTSIEHEKEFQRSGDPASLDNALAIRRYLLTDAGAPFVPEEIRLSNVQGLSRILQQRFRAAGALRDLDEAIAEAERGMETLPEGHALRFALLAELGNGLNVRFREFRDRNDIDRAILIFEKLLARPPESLRDPEDRLTAPVNVATALLDRYDAFKLPGDLNRSIDLQRQVVNSTPIDSPRRPLRMNNLGSALYHRFRDSGDRAALKEAITIQREVATSKEAGLRAHALAALARSLDAAAHIGDADAEEYKNVFRQACQVGLQVSISDAMWAGMTWGRESWARGDLEAAAEAYGYCVDGARLLFQRQGAARERSQEIRLSQFREAAPRAAFALAGAGRFEDAVVIFELSRAQLLFQAIERGLSLRKAPDLDAEIQTTATAGETNALGDFGISEIRVAAGERPLVYLIYTDRGGVALLVQQSKVVAVPLPLLTSMALEERVQTYFNELSSSELQVRIESLDATTRWLWDTVMAPVLEELNGVDEIMLVPGGLLGLLPIHAAWTPDATRADGRRYALDVATFSYVPSGRSLAYSRASAATPISRQAIARAVIVADPQPVDVGPLEYATDEADIVKWHLPQAVSVAGNSATLPQVSDLLPGSELIHLACHGFADLETPLKSGVVLAANETLSVRMIRDLHLNARLAVLSACRTGIAGTALPDEVVAMPTGLLQAGVAGIVASLWSVPDRATAMLMAEFYRRLFQEKQTPAIALRGAQQWMRDTTNLEKVGVWELGSGDWLPPNVAQRFCDSIEQTMGRVYSSPWWWAAFVQVGV